MNKHLKNFLIKRMTKTGKILHEAAAGLDDMGYELQSLIDAWAGTERHYPRLGNLADFFVLRDDLHIDRVRATTRRVMEGMVKGFQTEDPFRSGTCIVAPSYASGAAATASSQVVGSVVQGATGASYEVMENKP